jgi:putative SOS response-associated peptidase YedK
LELSAGGIKMCGRFSRFSIKPVIIEEFGIEEIGFDFEADYNIAPGRDIAAVIGGDKKQLVKLRWGLIPSWSKDPAVGYKMINARAETIAEKPSFRTAFKKLRCLIIADGFFEWGKDGKLKKPYYITMKSARPFGFAGLYARWVSSDGEEINSCTIVTTQANELLKPIHERMPVIVDRKDENIWLDPEIFENEKLGNILKPFDSEAMTVFEVDRIVNSPTNNSPECIRPV